MKLIEVLENKIFDFPLESNDYFPDHIFRIFQHYISLLESVDDEYAEIINQNLPKIYETRDSILTATSSIFGGNTAKAYDMFSETIKYLEPFLTSPDKNFVQLNPTHLFKARKTMDGQFGLKDMFHVPFEKRYETSTTRFSLPGVPCLYLANSIYTCWEELDRPVFSQMPVSRYELKGKNFKFLDLSNNRKFIIHSLKPKVYVENAAISREKEKELFESIIELIKTFVLPRFINTYPLFAACYIKVFNKDFYFKPEYIFPQMLMQWIMTQNDIDGIKYLSTKSKALNNPWSLRGNFFNYAIPIQSFQKIGYCPKMAEMINLTEPLTYELFSVINPVKANTLLDYEKDIKNKVHASPIDYINLNNSNTYYLDTTFGLLEHKLLNMEVKSLLA